jgi:hypothetical protein
MVDKYKPYYRVNSEKEEIDWEWWGDSTILKEYLQGKMNWNGEYRHSFRTLF